MPSAVVGALRVVFGAETAAFEKGATEVERRLSATQKKLGKLSDKFASAGKVLSVGLTAPLAAFGVSAFRAASDAAELDAAFGQTFGSMSGSMRKWAEETGEALGRSTQEMKEAANTFGIFFNQAVDPQKAAQMSQTFAQLAEDLGSFYNVDTETAIAKLRSGLVGESEPLRDFGVILTEAKVKAKAMEMGLTGVGNELTEQEKILARYQLIMESTTKAQGDVLRTSDGTANQMRDASGAIEDLQVAVGQKLLPALTPLIETLADAVKWFTDLPKPAQNFALGVGAIATAIGPALLGFSGMINAFGTLLPLLTKLGPVITVVRTALLGLLANPIILGAAAVIAGIYLAWKHWDEISAIVKRVYTAVKTWLMDKLGPVIKWVGDKVKGLIEPFRLLWDKVVGHSYIPDMVDAIGQHMARLDALMVQPAVAATTATAQAFQALQQRVSGILDRLFPEQAAFNQLKRDIDDLTAYAAKAGWSPSQLDESLRRARSDYYKALPTPQAGPFDQAPLIGSAGTDIAQQAGDAAAAATGKWADAQKAKAQVTQNILGALADTLSRVGGIGGRTFNSIADTIGRQLIPAIQGANGALQNMQSLATQVGSLFGSIFGAIFGKKVGGVVGTIASAAFSVFARMPGRAAGGPVAGGRPYMVGEVGPELFIPASAGKIVPNNRLGGERSAPIVFDLRGAVMTEDLLRQMNAMADGAAIRGATGGAALAHRQAARAANRRLG